MNYVPLWIKTDYSILCSLINVDDLILKLASLGIKAAAICDDDLCGTMEFINKCNLAGIKPIVGMELKVGFPLLVYAKNYKGYQRLCNLSLLKKETSFSIQEVAKNTDDLLVVIPFNHQEVSGIFPNPENVFIGYQTKEEQGKINANKVYVKKILSLNEEDEKYLPYLYQIKEEEFLEKNVSLTDEMDVEIRKDNSYFANLCDLKIPKQTFLLPKYNDDDGFDAQKYLTELCVVGLRKRLNGKVDQKYVDRLKYELEVIIKMGFCNYFLVVWDYVKYAKKNNILVGPGRGSAASSLVSYCLGITDIDPIKYDLLFERFLNPERITMPDIDIDFDAEKRQEVISYVTNKYGNKRVCGIITFSNLLAKQVIRDLSRVFDISNYKIDSFLKNFDDKKNLKEQLKNINVRRIISNDEEMKKLYDVAVHLEGLKRHSSVHAAGIIISSKNLTDYVPLMVNEDGTYLCGYTMNYIEELGLLKMDFLGLKNLTIIDRVISDIKGLNFNEIPLDDRKTYELFASGNLDGIFQFESAGMRKFISELKPDKIDDLIAAVALFRPGPIDNIPSYVARRNGKEKVNYINKALEPILKSTYGIIVYQEQIMQIASTMAGFSYGEADVLRRAMSKKKQDVLAGQRKKFIDGSINNGYDEKEAEEVYDLILKFANYGFNKAHSVSYAIIGYKMAYLKVHYPLPFMREMLNNYIGVINKTKNAINECKKLGLKIKKPDINTSSYEYKIKEGQLEYSLSMIKAIGTLTCKKIVSERNENGLYSSYLDFVKRSYKLGKDVMRNLILAGALDCFGETRKTLIENLPEAINYAELCADLDEALVVKPEIKKYEEYSKEELTSQEESLYGFYISNHPTDKYLSEGSITSQNINNYFDKTIKITLLFERKKEIETKNKEKMMFITASDTYGNVELIMFPKVYNKYFYIIFPGVYEVTGKVEKRFSKMQIIIYDLKKLD